MVVYGGISPWWCRRDRIGRSIMFGFHVIYTGPQKGSSYTYPCFLCRSYGILGNKVVWISVHEKNKYKESTSFNAFYLLRLI